ncbi:MAG: hypothetical protein AABW79_00145 [Nanoarchaeota archaeon]
MTNMTLSVPEELMTLIRKHTQIKWSEIARRAMWEEAEKLELLDKLVSKSKFTEKDVEEIGNKIKRGIARRHGLNV